MNILLVTNNKEIREKFAFFSQALHFKVHIASTYEESLELISRYQIVLTIIHLTSTDENNGQELCKHLRTLSEMPILLIMEAEVSDCTIIEALEYGADLCIQEPESSDLLYAYIMTLLRQRRSELVDRGFYVDPHMSIYTAQQRAVVNGKQVRFTATENQLLKLLIANREQPISILEIIEEIWGDLDTKDRYAPYVRVLISRLRKKLEVDPTNPLYILNEHGFGYYFTSPH